MLRLLRPPSLNHDLGPSGLSYAANRPLNMLMERVALIDSRPWRSIQICAKNVREERERERERERGSRHENERIRIKLQNPAVAPGAVEVGSENN